MGARFDKSFTRQEPLPEAAVERVAAIMRSGILHRYGAEESEASALERDYADWQGARFCVAVASGGQALQIAMRAAGMRPGDAVLANAWTLAPVPGAMHAVGARPVFVEIGENWRIDVNDLAAKAEASGARVMMLSHMRGHIADMDAVMEVCRRHGILVIEDCAHTMGARWDGMRSGNHGHIACFSTQTYKHVNSGEGGLLTTDDEEVAARAVIASGSYMLYARHGAAPSPAVFERVRLAMPNCSARMDEARAAMVRAQLPGLDLNVERWNERHDALEETVRAAGIRVPERSEKELRVGSSFQFHADVADVPAFVSSCAGRGVEVKWFGADVPVGFTSRYDSWAFLGPTQDLPRTRAVLATTCDIRVPLTFTVEDCRTIGTIVAEELERAAR